MARLSPLQFDISRSYEETESGLIVPVALVHGSRRVEIDAKLDTGASDCLFDSQFAELLELDWQNGFERNYRTLTGSIRAFGHEVAISTFGLEWEAIVYFYESDSRANAFLGRRGWLDRVRLGLVHYEQNIYLSRYE